MAWQQRDTSCPVTNELFEALKGSQTDHFIDAVLLPKLKDYRRDVLISLVELCAHQQLTVLRQKYSKSIGQFCRSLIESLVRARVESWPAMTASLRLLEGVLLICTTAPEDRLRVCNLMHMMLKARFHPKTATSRLECACMCFSEPLARRLCADEQLPKHLAENFTLELELQKLAEESRPTPAFKHQRAKVFESFNRVIYECFSTHGKQFGSSVNGFETHNSDIDIMVLIPPEEQERLIADAIRRRDEGPTRVPEDASTPEPDWNFLSGAHKRRARSASIVAVRNVADKLRAAGFNVCEVIESARVPLVKCKHALVNPEDTQGGEPIEFEVDISFCNEVAWFNSHLLLAYAEFDPRAMWLGVLVKLWAKRRKINSAFEGTLSSYSYVLMVVHYLQHRGIVPNLQRPREEVLAVLGITSTDRIIEGIHNVWFLDPLRKTGTENAEAGGIAGNDGSNRPNSWWMGHVPHKVGILDLFYGFFRYFGLEFNYYGDVVSIRSRDPPVQRKLNYFASFADEEEEGSEAGDEDMPAEAEEAVQEDAATSAPPSHQMEGEASDDPENTPASGTADEPYRMAGSSEYDDFVSSRSADPILAPGTASGMRMPVGATEMEDAEDLPADQRYTGKVTFYSAENGWGSIHCQKALEQYGGKVWLSQDEFEVASLSMDDDVQFSLVRNAQGCLQATNVTRADDSTEMADPPASEKALAFPPNSYAPLPEILIGTVKTFKLDSGFGFIACLATHAHYSRDVFLHQNQATGVEVGDRVSFSVEINSKKQPQARQVTKVSSDEKETPPVLLPDAQRTSLRSSDVDTDKRTDRRAQLLQSRLKSRQCLTIDDPMEHNRALGVTFSGQEAISYEMRRSLSLLKHCKEGLIEAIFTEKLPKTSKSKWERECSPPPAQLLEVNPESGENQVILEVERPLKKETVGLLIGVQGSTIKWMREQSGCEDLRVSDTRSGPVLCLRGPPANVCKALELAEQAQEKREKTGRNRRTKGTPKGDGKGDGSPLNAFGVSKDGSPPSDGSPWSGKGQSKGDGSSPSDSSPWAGLQNIMNGARQFGQPQASQASQFVQPQSPQSPQSQPPPPPKPPPHPPQPPQSQSPPPSPTKAIPNGAELAAVLGKKSAIGVLSSSPVGSPARLGVGVLSSSPVGSPVRPQPNRTVVALDSAIQTNSHSVADSAIQTKSHSVVEPIVPPPPPGRWRSGSGSKPDSSASAAPSVASATSGAPSHHWEEKGTPLPSRGAIRQGKNDMFNFSWLRRTIAEQSQPPLLTNAMDASAVEAKLIAEASKTSFYPRQQEPSYLQGPLHAEQSSEASRGRQQPVGSEASRGRQQPVSSSNQAAVQPETAQGTLKSMLRSIPPPVVESIPPPVRLVEQRTNVMQTEAELAGRRKKGTKIRLDT